MRAFLLAVLTCTFIGNFADAVPNNHKGGVCPQRTICLPLRRCAANAGPLLRCGHGTFIDGVCCNVGASPPRAQYRALQSRNSSSNSTLHPRPLSHRNATSPRRNSPLFPFEGPGKSPNTLARNASTGVYNRTRTKPSMTFSQRFTYSNTLNKTFPSPINRRYYQGFPNRTRLIKTRNYSPKYVSKLNVTSYRKNNTQHNFSTYLPRSNLTSSNTTFPKSNVLNVRNYGWSNTLSYSPRKLSHEEFPSLIDNTMRFHKRSINYNARHFVGKAAESRLTKPRNATNYTSSFPIGSNVHTFRQFPGKLSNSTRSNITYLRQPNSNIHYRSFPNQNRTIVRYNHTRPSKQKTQANGTISNFFRKLFSKQNSKTNRTSVQNVSRLRPTRSLHDPSSVPSESFPNPYKNFIQSARKGKTSTTTLTVPSTAEIRRILLKSPRSKQDMFRDLMDNIKSQNNGRVVSGEGTKLSRVLSNKSPVSTRPREKLE